MNLIQWTYTRPDLKHDLANDSANQRKHGHPLEQMLVLPLEHPLEIQSIQNHHLGPDEHMRLIRKGKSHKL